MAQNFSHGTLTAGRVGVIEDHQLAGWAGAWEWAGASDVESEIESEIESE